MPVNAAQLRIVVYPHPALRTPGRPIAQINDQIRQVAQAMLRLMHEAPGVGLAAPQVGLPWRLFVANPTGEPDDDRVFVNPVLSQLGPESEDHEEGCLSIPQVTGIIRRPKAATIDALDLDGNSFHLASDDLAARVWQHETDHLDGTLIIDRMTPGDRLANQKLLRDLEKAARR